MANGNGSFWSKVTPGNWIQAGLLFFAAVMGWASLNSAVDRIVEREQEHYEILREEINSLEDKFDVHVRDFVDHIVGPHHPGG